MKTYFQFPPVPASLTTPFFVVTNFTSPEAAVAMAYATGSELYWPAGTYVTTASIPNFHAVPHVGPGIVQREANLFAVAPVPTSANSLFVSPLGTAGNDGLSAGTAMLWVNEAFAALTNYGPMLEGTWTINLAAGTYSASDDYNLTIDAVRSRNPLVITGPTITWPDTPTARISGVTGKGWEFDSGMDLDLRYLKFQGFTASSALIFFDKVSATLTNVHTFDCLIGILCGTHCRVIYSGVIDGNNISNSIGFQSIIMTYYRLGEPADDPLLSGPVVKNCDNSGVLVTDGSTGHVNARIIDCDVGLNVSSRSRADFDNSNFERCSVAIRVTSNAEVRSTSAFTFNDGTADACDENIRVLTGGLNIANAPMAATWTVERRDLTSSTHTGTTAETWQRGFFWSKHRGFGAPDAAYVGKALRIRAAGNKTGTAGTLTCIVRLHTSAAAGGSQIGGAASSTAADSRWEFTCEVHLHTNAATQVGFSALRQDNEPVQTGRHTQTVDLHNNLDHYFNLNLTLGSTADSTTVDFFDVEVMG